MAGQRGGGDGVLSVSDKAVMVVCMQTAFFRHSRSAR